MSLEKKSFFTRIKYTFIRNWRRISIVAVLLGIFASIASISGYDFKDFFEEHESTSLQLTVYVHGTISKQDYILENTGELLVDFEGDRRSAKIGEKGRTVFSEIPLKYRNQPVPIHLKAKGYQLELPNKMHILNEKPIYLGVKSSCFSCRIYGVIEKGSKHVSNAIVTVDYIKGVVDTTDNYGFFDLLIPPDQEQKQYIITVLKNGEIVYQEETTPAPGVPTKITLFKKTELKSK